MSHTAIVPEPTAVRNYLLQHRLPLYYSKPVLAHLETYMTAIHPIRRTVHGDEANVFFADVLCEVLNGDADPLGVENPIGLQCTDDMIARSEARSTFTAYPSRASLRIKAL